MPEPRRRKQQSVAAAAGPVVLLALFTTAVSAADVEHGKALYQTCAACRVVGRKSAALDDYRYSNPMRRANLVWDEDNLRAYIQDPQAKVKGNRMPYGGLSDPAGVGDIIAYLRIPKKSCPLDPPGYQSSAKNS